MDAGRREVSTSLDTVVVSSFLWGTWFLHRIEADNQLKKDLKRVKEIELMDADEFDKLTGNDLYLYETYALAERREQYLKKQEEKLNRYKEMKI